MDDLVTDLNDFADELALLVERWRAELSPARPPVGINLGEVDEWLFEEDAAD